MAVQSSVITRDLDKIAAQTGNVYESVVIISKRARQIAVNILLDLYDTSTRLMFPADTGTFVLTYSRNP